jgi:hypothetical protein
VSDAEEQAAKMAEQAALKLAGKTGQKIEETVNKGLAVAEDAESGAAFGASFGPYGAAIGGAAGAVYGVIDNFGGDISDAVNDVLGGPKYNAGDYDRMRTGCANAGGTPTPGVAPDDARGCTFPDGTTAGGYTPEWSSRAEWEADQAARAAQLGQLGDYVHGLQKIDAIVKLADASMRKAGATSNAKDRAVGKIVDAAQVLYTQTGQDRFAPFNRAAWVHDIGARIFTPPPARLATVKLTASSVARIHALATQGAHPVTAVLQHVQIHPQVIASAHAVVNAAKSGDPTASAFIADTTARARAGDPSAHAAALVLTIAAEAQIIRKYADKYLYGKNIARPLTTGEAPPCGCVGCASCS